MRNAGELDYGDEPVELIEFGPPLVLLVDGRRVSLERKSDLLHPSKLRLACLEQANYLLGNRSTAQWDEFAAELWRRAQDRGIDR